MRSPNNSRRGAELLSAGVFLCILLTACQSFSAEYGKVAGNVTDRSGNPIMGATVLLSGPGLDTSQGLLEGSLNRVFTDAKGNFTIGRVAPGWYSLQVISPSKLPGFRSRVQVMPGTTTREAFALGDILSGIHWQNTGGDLHAWDQGWKWILRTSSSTRPILRYAKSDRDRRKATEHTPLPAQHVVAMVPGSLAPTVFRRTLERIPWSRICTRWI